MIQRIKFIVSTLLLLSFFMFPFSVSLALGTNLTASDLQEQIKIERQKRYEERQKQIAQNQLERIKRQQAEERTKRLQVVGDTFKAIGPVVETSISTLATGVQEFVTYRAEKKRTDAHILEIKLNNQAIKDAEEARIREVVMVREEELARRKQQLEDAKMEQIKKIDETSRYNDDNLPFQLSGVTDEGRAIIDDSQPINFIPPFVAMDFKKFSYQGKKFCVNKRFSKRVLGQKKSIVYHWDLATDPKQKILKTQYIEKDSYLEDCPLYSIVKNRISEVEYLSLEKYVTVTVYDDPNAPEKTKFAFIHLSFPELLLRDGEAESLNRSIQLTIKSDEFDNDNSTLIVDSSFSKSDSIPLKLESGRTSKEENESNDQVHYYVNIKGKRELVRPFKSISIQSNVTAEKEKKRGLASLVSRYHISFNVKIAQIDKADTIERSRIECYLVHVGKQSTETSEKSVQFVENPRQNQIVNFEISNFSRNNDFQIVCQEQRYGSQFFTDEWSDNITFDWGATNH